MLLGLTGCASIAGDSIQIMPISSTPSNAQVVITDEKGIEVYTGTTPTSVPLEKSDGSYFGGKTYIVKIDKEGYQPRLITINSEANGWYIGGNLVFGGLIGWLIVDPMSGNMYKLTPEAIEGSLEAEGNSRFDGSNRISVMLLQDLPISMHAHLQPLQ